MDKIKYILCWATKYRKPTLPPYANRIRELIREICKNFNVDIVSGAVRKDHIKLVVAKPAGLPLPKLLQHIKGKSAYYIFKENPTLKQQLRGPLWQHRYYAKELD